MAPEESLALLEEFLHSSTNVAVIMAARDTKQRTFKIRRLELHDRLARAFRDPATAHLRSSIASLLVPYELDYHPQANEIAWTEISSKDSLKRVFDDIPTIDSIEVFEDDDATVKQLHFFATVLEDSDGNQAVLFRKYSPTKELSKRKGLIPAILSNGSYDILTERTFLFDSIVDCFAWKEHVFITSVHNFHLIFGFIEDLKCQAQEMADYVVRALPILNEDEFCDACSRDINMMLKLANIKANNYVNNITIGDIKSMISSFNLNIEVALDGNVEKLVFNKSPRTRWEILKLLNDDYLQSMLTNRKYGVNSKFGVR